jgi:hypothetical protein
MGTSKVGGFMKKQPIVILPVAAALAGLGGVADSFAATGESVQKVMPQENTTGTAIKAQPDFVFEIGEDLFGMTVTQQADGTVLAGHSSHYSHSSHRSHYSSRY